MHLPHAEDRRDELLNLILQVCPTFLSRSTLYNIDRFCCHIDNVSAAFQALKSEASKIKEELKTSGFEV
jgi:hypothetical protein